jgi:hypothetical protein
MADWCPHAPARNTTFHRLALRGSIISAAVEPEGNGMSTPQSSRKNAGIGIGGVLVIAGIVIAIAWSVILGIIVAIIGLVAFGGFVRGKWY